MRIWVISILLTLVYSFNCCHAVELSQSPIINKPFKSVYDDPQFSSTRAATYIGNYQARIKALGTFIPTISINMEAARSTASHSRSMLLRTVKNISTVRGRTGCRMRGFSALCTVFRFNSIERKNCSGYQYNLIFCCVHNVFFKVSDIKLLPSCSLFLIN